MHKIQNLANSPFEQWNNILITLDYESPEVLPDDPQISSQLCLQKQKRRTLFSDSLNESIFEDFDGLSAKGVSKEEAFLTPLFQKFFLLIHTSDSRKLEPYLFSLLDLLSMEGFEAKKLGYVLGALLFHLDPNVLLMSLNMVLKDLQSGDFRKMLLALNLINQCADEQMVLASLPLIKPYIAHSSKDFKVDFC